VQSSALMQLSVTVGICNLLYDLLSFLLGHHMTQFENYGSLKNVEINIQFIWWHLS